MFFTNLFNFKRQCTHEKITPDMETGYCPDCGKLIRNDWYITRCSCCGVKLKTMASGGEIHPQNRYCTNCGSNEYTIEKLPKINFIDINFAVLQKTEVDEEKRTCTTTRCWQEKSVDIPKLTVKYL